MSSSAKNREPKKNKAELLESLVARLHEINGFRTETRVLLPSLGNTGQTREIDVLLTVNAGPYELKIPIECKNKGRPVSVGQIGEFRDKLDDVGLSTRGAIFVSVVGFQSGAERRALELGILPMQFKGLAGDRLKQAVLNATSGTLFLLPELRQTHYKSDHPTGAISFSDAGGEFGGLQMDLVWKHWMDLANPKLGLYKGVEAVPDGWGSYENGSFADVQSIDFEIDIRGHLLLQSGQATTASLRAVSEPFPRLLKVQARFQSPMGELRLVNVDSEDELKLVMKGQRSFLAVLHRVKVPRLSMRDEHNDFAWPPSDEVVAVMGEILREMHRDGADGAVQHCIVDDDTDISRLFLPPSKTYTDGLRSKLGASWRASLWSEPE